MIDLQQAGSGLDGYAMLCAQLESLLADERDFIANSAQFSAFLFNQLDDLNWAGFTSIAMKSWYWGPSRGRSPVCAFHLVVACVVRLRQRGKPSAWRMCTRSQAISPVTALRTVNW